MQHAVYAITALRWRGQGIDQAMMGLLDVDRMQWDLAPSPARTSAVIDRLLEGDTVITLLGDPAHPRRLGPGLKVGVSPDGEETLAEDEALQSGSLNELPRF
jgi:hypothetical protein